MLSPLPRVYEEGHNGQAVPSEPEPTMIGGDVQVERLTSAAQETKKRLDIEVLQPIKQWMVAYRTIMVRALIAGCSNQDHQGALVSTQRPLLWAGTGGGCSSRQQPPSACSAAALFRLRGVREHLEHFPHHYCIKIHTPYFKQERMKRLEALRLELDSRRRTVTDLQGALRLVALIAQSLLKAAANNCETPGTRKLTLQPPTDPPHPTQTTNLTQTRKHPQPSLSACAPAWPPCAAAARWTWSSPSARCSTRRTRCSARCRSSRRWSRPCTTASSR